MFLIIKTIVLEVKCLLRLLLPPDGPQNPHLVGPQSPHLDGPQKPHLGVHPSLIHVVPRSLRAKVAGNTSTVAVDTVQVHRRVHHQAHIAPAPHAAVRVLVKIMFYLIPVST